MKISLKAYRVLTYLFLGLLIVGLCLSVYEYFIAEQEYGMDGLLINIIIIFLFFTIRYYLLKTKNIFLLQLNEIIENENLVGFKFDKATGVWNLIVGLAITAFPVFIFLKYPINLLGFNEIIRICLLLLVGIYGVLKINYSMLTLKMLFNIKNN